MIVYRICKSKYADNLSGTGAALYGGRWNPPGLPMLYTSATVSLAILEYLAHNLHVLRKTDLTLLKLQIVKKSKIETVDVGDLPKDWSESSYIPSSTQKIGQEFLINRRVYGLRVPSVLVPGESNILLNPVHDDHKNLKILKNISPFRIDERLMAEI